MNRRFIFILIIISAFLIALFERFNRFDIAPTLMDTTSEWLGNSPRLFTAQVDNIGAWEVEVGVHWTRHFWLGKANPRTHFASMVPSPDDPSLFTFAVPEAESFSTADALFYQITMTYRPPESSNSEVTVVEAYENNRRILVNATDASVTTTLNEIRDRVLPNLVQVWSQSQVPPHSLYANISTHGWVSTSQLGLAFPRLTGASQLIIPPPELPPSEHPQLENLNIDAPDLILYQAINSNGTAVQTSAVSDCLAETEYKLVGWAYGLVFDPYIRPYIVGIPSDKWFVHKAGYHLFNGQMQLTTPAESFPGQSIAPSSLNTLPFQTPSLFGPPLCGTEIMIWHPRIWTLHVWLDPNDPVNGTPTLSIFAPDTLNIPGIEPLVDLFFEPHLVE